jgi:hypothetical protein
MSLKEKIKKNIFGDASTKEITKTSKIMFKLRLFFTLFIIIGGLNFFSYKFDSPFLDNFSSIFVVFLMLATFIQSIVALNKTEEKTLPITALVISSIVMFLLTLTFSIGIIIGLTGI